MKPKLIVFDLNKTLINENSWYDLNKAMGVTDEEDAELMRRAEAGEITDAQGQAWLLSAYKERGDTSKGSIQRIVEQYTYLLYAQEVVAALGERGYELALVSGAMDVLVEKVAGELKIPHWRASNQFVFKDSKLEDIKAPEKDSHDKLMQCKDLVHSMGIEMNECLVIGDGANDIELFRATGNGVTFEDSPIKSEARFVIADLRDLLNIVR